MRYELNIPVATPSLNRTQRRHWSHGYHAKKRWQKLVRDAVLEHCKLPVTALNRARVTITRYSPWPIKDYDNLVGGAKNLIDSLVTNGLIVDDSEQHINLHVRQGDGRGKPRCTHVLIEAMTA